MRYMATSTGFYWTFTSDYLVTYWGVQFTVTPVCANGYYFASSTAACVACTVLGTSTTGASLGQTQTACSPCAAGSYVLSAGAACTLVPAGIHVSCYDGCLISFIAVTDLIVWILDLSVGYFIDFALYSSLCTILFGLYLHTIK